jgi:hypothetical protein
MLDRTDPNPREHVGANNPPPATAIELAEPTIEALRKFLNDFPVIANEDEAREAKAIGDRVYLTLKSIEEERDSKVRPLNEQVSAINAEYHRWFSTNDKKPGLWGTLLKELKVRLTAFARLEEQKRREAAEAARRAAEEAERKARAAEAAERAAAAEAAAGVCDTDFAGATERADAAFAEFQRADRAAQRAERDTKVRIGGGFGKVTTLRTVETLTVTDWQAAITEIGLTDRIKDAILTEARAFRKDMGELPSGVTATYDRSL